ncbi:MAG: adenine phosphoribosyltransferase [Bacteroidales bacterium]|nr:adenine phosphoribosyltransferase [Bacteroidales bacterium]
MDINAVKQAIRDVPDFPKPGILFKDITTAIKNPEIVSFLSKHIADYYRNKGINKVAGIESRGFIFGSILALQLNAGFIPVRKPGKLPAETLKKTYSLEYGEDAVEIHKDAINPGDIVLLHDDLLATGGTALAALELLQELGAKKVYTNFLIELEFLKGIERLKEYTEVYSLIKY